MIRHGVLLIAWLAWSLVSVAVVRGQTVTEPDDSSHDYQSLPTVANAIGTAQYEGNSRCQRCHGHGLYNEDFQNGVSERVCLNEASYWKDADLHADAYTELIAPGSRGQRIGALLKADVTKPETGCIQCHAPLHGIAPEANAGVSCEACHGPSSAWYPRHDQRDINLRPTWPNVPLKGPQSKTEFGWIDIRSPVTRAELCTSCHVGSERHGRVVTHAMYAAGHPPLSGFEIESFADNMPRHWRYANEKKSTDATERTKNLLVGAVVAMRMAIELTVADANAPSTSKRWPELARLDCYTCHHELETPSTRQVDTGLPGRPPLILGSLPLVRVAARVAMGAQADADLDAQLAMLKIAFKSNPLGDSGQISQAGAVLRAWCRNVEKQIAAKEFQTPQIRELLRQIAEQPTSENCDYDSARQLLGAWVVICGELPPNEASTLMDKFRRAIDVHRLPGLASPGPSKSSCKAPPPKKQIFADVLDRHFTGRAAFDPASFKGLMLQLASITEQ
jgi:cytochrome c554/c'-like protein